MSSLTSPLYLLLILVVLLYLLHRRVRGADLTSLDDLDVPHQRFTGAAPDDPAQRTLVQKLQPFAALMKLPMREQIPALRRFMDELSNEREFDARFVSVDKDGVRGEWVLANGADPARRVLYIHGGAFTMGSPRSHRALTTRFSHMSKASVFALDYRLMPEHPRLAGVEDCRTAYRWLLANGPDGAVPASALFVAGDSAGGNLTLSTIAWARDAGLPAATAAVALSPLTDATLTSPSVKGNHATDTVLAPMAPWAPRMPTFLLPWMGWIIGRMLPSNPIVSPLRGSLAHLPPTLIQASDCEMLYDDARRYAAKAHAAGSPVVLQTWSHMVHVWQIFDEDLEDAEHALAQIGHFLTSVGPARN